MKRKCIFCKIYNNEIPAKVVYKDKKFIAFYDIKPLAPVHILVVPKKHIDSLNELKNKEKGLIGELFLVIKKIVKKMNLINKGYKVVINVGKGGGQIIYHLHFHLLGGWRSNEEREEGEMP